MRRTVLILAGACLLAAPTVLAFYSGGYFAQPRLIAGIVIWALVLVVAAVGPAPLPERLAEAFGGRVDSLPSETRAALLVAAAGDDGDLEVLARAGAPADALAVAEAAGLVRLGAGRVGG